MSVQLILTTDKQKSLRSLTGINEAKVDSVCNSDSFNVKEHLHPVTMINKVAVFEIFSRILIFKMQGSVHNGGEYINYVIL